MKKVQILDSTLRDGGYRNNWLFGANKISGIFRGLIDANIDIIETGLLNEYTKDNENSSVYSCIEQYEKRFNNIDTQKSKVVLMLKYGTYSIDKFKQKKSRIIDGIRVYFRQSELAEVVKYCHQIKEELGYDVYLNPVNIFGYNDKELEYLIEKVNQLKPYSLAIVDTFGIMQIKDLQRYFDLFDKKLNEKINLGLHVHNSLELSFANSIAFTEFDTKRNLIIDSSLLGIGKGCGICQTELIINYLKSKFSYDYKIEAIEKTILTQLNQETVELSTEEKLLYRISALNRCHPDYAFYLRKVLNLSFAEIQKKLSFLDTNKKFNFDERYFQFANSI